MVLWLEKWNQEVEKIKILTFEFSVSVQHVPRKQILVFLTISGCCISGVKGGSPLDGEVHHNSIISDELQFFFTYFFLCELAIISFFACD